MPGWACWGEARTSPSLWGFIAWVPGWALPTALREAAQAQVPARIPPLYPANQSHLHFLKLYFTKCVGCFYWYHFLRLN